MRTFVSIELDNQHLSSKLDDICTKMGAPARKNPYHLTLAFLDDVDKDAAIQAGEYLKSVRFGVFDMQLTTIGTFGSKFIPQVVWVGVGKGRDGVMALSDSVSRALVPLGLSQDKRITPHITLFRVKSKANKVIDMIAEHKNEVFGVQSVHKISLVRSEPSEGGHTHHILQTVGALA